ncbi:MAG: glutamate--tRNA ligase [Maricaulaceae bacterium]
MSEPRFETVRFAPSPTGKLHVGNLRTALMNQLIVRAGGRFILRIDDTDLERSKDVYRVAIERDLAWLGFRIDAQVKQSDRFALYDAAADALKTQGRLYPCYETEDELDRKRKLRRAQGLPPVYDRAALNLTESDKQALEAEGRKPHWRFKLSGETVAWRDRVRGDQTIDTASISDPILVREDGSYLYTLPSVVDDIDLGVTLIIRGEDHVTNSGAQIEIFEALKGRSPDLAHTPLLVGADGEKLSKRLGSLTIEGLREEGIEPLALLSLLAKIGTSDAVELRDSLEALAADFDFAKIGRAPARFDEADLTRLNAQILHAAPYAQVQARLAAAQADGGEAFWLAVRENCSRPQDAKAWYDIVFGAVTGEIPAEDRSFIETAAAHLPTGALDGDSWGEWTSALKAETGRKGKALFMPLRLALTGQSRGPDMAALLALIGRERALQRLTG